MRKVGDIIMLQMGAQKRPCKITRIIRKANIASAEEMHKDSLGRLRGYGEDGKFSTTLTAANNALLLRR